MHPSDRERNRGFQSPLGLRAVNVFRTAAAVAALCAFLGGCATTDEGDMPWNAPQSWEGSPYLPGLSDRY